MDTQEHVLEKFREGIMGQRKKKVAVKVEQGSDGEEEQGR